MRIILIRHGDPDYERDSLTPKGWREAELLSKRVSRWDVRDFYCSPLGRAKDTASLSLKKMGREAAVYEWMKEFYVPVLDPETGKERGPWDFMPAYWTNEPGMYDRAAWMDTPVMKTGDKNPMRRCRGLTSCWLVMAEREGDHGFGANDDTIVLFCHLGVSCVMLSHLLGISPVLLWHGFFPAPTSVTVLNSEERDPAVAYFRCQVLGDTTHLHDGGEPVSKSGYYTLPFQD
ncbi:MAG: histidine phosphatase family protein [Oscillospiraceae bacterium]